MRTSCLSALALAALAVPNAFAQSAPCWGPVSQPPRWYVAGPSFPARPIVISRGITTTRVSASAVVYPAYYPSYWAYAYPQPEAYASYRASPTFATPTQTYQHTGLRRYYEEKYDPAEPGGPNH
jgi:hypothetical protein